MIFHKKEPKKTYNYEQVFQKLMLKLETLDHAAENIQEILNTILQVVSATSGSIFLFQKEAKLFILKKWIGDKPLNVSIAQEYEFIAYLKQGQTALFKDEILKNNKHLDIRAAGINYFTQLSCAAVVPLVLKNEWIGLLNVGRSSEKRAYEDEDRSMLVLLGYWLAHHLANTRLFSQLSFQNKKLAEVTELKNQLMANVTHELRTPLNGILGLTDLILDGSDGDINEDQKRHLEMIKNAGNSLLEVINNILSLIKVESTRNDVAIRRLDLTRLVSEISYLFEGILASKQTSFCSHLNESIYIYGDEDQARTLLMNLIGNATKFTQQGSIEIFAEKSGEMVKVCVKDTGIGIPIEEQQKIFEEFRQVDGSKTREFGGTGLGLSIAKKIVSLHGGRIWVDSIPGKGSEFYFTLPTKPAVFQLEHKNAS